MEPIVIKFGNGHILIENALHSYIMVQHLQSVGELNKEGGVIGGLFPAFRRKSVLVPLFRRFFSNFPVSTAFLDFPFFRMFDFRFSDFRSFWGFHSFLQLLHIVLSWLKTVKCYFPVSGHVIFPVFRRFSASFPLFRGFFSAFPAFRHKYYRSSTKKAY